MKKAQAALVACAFIFMFQMKAQAQQPFSNAYDYNQQLQFAFNVIALVDSKYLTLSSSLDYFGNFDRCALLTWYSNDVLDSQKCLLNTGNEIYIGEPGSFQEDARGGYFFGGSTNRVYDTMYYLSFGMLIRYNGQGDTLFTRTYGDSSKWQAFYGSSQTQDSGYVMIGLQSDTVNYDNNYF
ncbi:MAG: hypothetical protein ABIQ74_11205, partial [Chitinophagales bacterium]